ncbi:MAG: hypothetical protein VCF24_01345 [Candidatus Latescibacterota bacterium]
MILMLSDVKKLFGELKGLLLGEAKRLLGAHVQMTHIEPSDEVLAWIDERMERTMVQLTLSLELMPDFHGIVERLAAAGSPVSLEELRRFLAWAADDPTRQIGVAAAQRGLAARGDGDAIHVEETAMGDLYNRVQTITERLPERPHTSTSDKITPLRRALKELANVRQETPTHPKQLGALAMVLVRLDRHPDYESLLEEVLWMGEPCRRRPGQCRTQQLLHTRVAAGDRRDRREPRADRRQGPGVGAGVDRGAQLGDHDHTAHGLRLGLYRHPFKVRPTYDRQTQGSDGDQ